MTANKEGAFSPPPDHAPQEVTKPGSERATPDQIAAARANERDLPTYAPPQLTREQMRAIIGKDPEQVNLGEIPAAAKPQTMADRIKAAAASVAKQTAKAVTSSFKGVDEPIKPKGRAIVITDLPEPGVRAGIEIQGGVGNVIENNVFIDNAADPDAERLPALQPAQPHQPAASDTDTPSRGLPTAVADQGKQITGGFGVPGDGADQYFPLDGTELRKVVLVCMDELANRIEDDLRFSIACTYPRAHVRVVIEVDAYGMEKTMEIPKVPPPHVGTPLEVARAYADQIVFVVVAERQEMTPDGQSVTPPNRMRLEAQLGIPRKQLVDVPGGRMFVDVKS